MNIFYKNKRVIFVIAVSCICRRELLCPVLRDNRLSMVTRKATSSMVERVQRETHCE